MTTPNAYHLGEMQDAQGEQARLGTQLKATGTAELMALQEAGLTQARRLAELGCGPSMATGLLAAWAPDAVITSVDYDSDTLTQSQHRRDVLGTRSVTVCADVQALPMEDGQFDAAYLRFVLQHVPNPVAALKEALRVVQPGGLVAALDGDNLAMVMFPRPACLDALLALSDAEHTRRGGDRSIGRKLPTHLASAGVGAVTARPVVATSGELGAGTFRTLFLDPLLRDVPLETDRARFCAELDRWQDTPGAFGLMVGVLAWGRKSVTQ